FQFPCCYAVKFLLNLSSKVIVYYICEISYKEVIHDHRDISLEKLGSLASCNLCKCLCSNLFSLKGKRTDLSGSPFAVLSDNITSLLYRTDSRSIGRGSTYAKLFKLANQACL